MDISPNRKLLLLEKDHMEITIKRQCQLIGISRSTAYYRSYLSNEDIKIMNKIDKFNSQYPFYGKRKITVLLRKEGISIGVKKVRKLMQKMGLETIYPKKKTSQPNKENKIYPYLLRNVEIESVNQVWATDITYIKMTHGFIYLVAVIDWYSRYVLAWDISTTMEIEFCLNALKMALVKYKPQIFNSDQGAQFTSHDFTEILDGQGIQISMDGRGRCMDNIFTERLWRTVKYEEVYLKDYQNPLDAYQNLKTYFNFYNNERPHQSLKYRTPEEIYHQNLLA